VSDYELFKIDVTAVNDSGETSGRAWASGKKGGGGGLNEVA
jgi:hypothetical protein